MRLAIDIGNTRIKAGLFSGERLVRYVRFENWQDEKWKNLVSREAISNAIVSSVETQEISDNMNLPGNIKILNLSHTTPLPVKNNYKTPETLGKDRLAGAIGGWLSSGQHSTLVIDAGTCIKYDFLDETDGYLGGSISPGLQMRLDAMHHFTARLPALQLKETTDFIGNDTHSAMMTGTVSGIIGEVKYFIELYKTRFGKINVLLTGGNADFISLHLENKYRVEPNLVLIGLNTILNYNLDNDQ